MGADQDLLFGRIAVNRGFCTQAQLDAGLNIQARSRDRLPIGQILLAEGYISQKQQIEILSIQRRNLTSVDPVQKASKESILLGKLAVREHLMTDQDVHTCLRLQAGHGEKRSLGEIMVEQGYLAPKQLKDLLAMQQKKIMSCPTCLLSFTVHTISQGKIIPCPRCRGPLHDGKPSDSVRTDANFDTTVIRKIIKEDKIKKDPEINPPGQDPMASSVRRVKMTCAICSTPFHEPVDTKGRVECPSCHSSYSA